MVSLPILTDFSLDLIVSLPVRRLWIYLWKAKVYKRYIQAPKAARKVTVNRTLMNP